MCHLWRSNQHLTQVANLYLFSMKQCTTCQSEKPLSEFSKVGRNSDKYKNSCKGCTAAKAREYRKAKRLDPEWVKKERERGREKYIRLEYKTRQKEWDKDKPWKQSSTLKNQVAILSYLVHQ